MGEATTSNPTGDSDQTVYGHHTNRVERTPDGWRIASMKLTPLWMTGNFGISMAALSAGTPSP